MPGRGRTGDNLQSPYIHRSRVWNRVAGKEPPVGDQRADPEPDNPFMATVYINDTPVEIDAAEQLNGIQVAQRAGVEIPHYCWHPGLSVVASCRMCLVETGTRNAETGDVQMVPKLVPACQTPARDGSVFITNSEKVDQARAMVEEDLLIDHPIDCPICDKAGECSLQDYHFKYGQDQRRADIRPFTSRRRPMGDTVTLFVDRCVMCSRCVRFCREITGTSELMVINRGAHEEIDVFPGYPLANKLSGNVVDLCPVGALGDRQFLYSQRVWFMKEHAGVCTGCSTGCSIHVDENQDRLYRLRPRENPHVNQWWMCDDGRYGWHYVHSRERVLGPHRRIDGEVTAADWTQLPEQLDGLLRKAAGKGRLAAALSPHLTVEEAYLLAEYVRGIDPAAVLAVAAIPVHGTDERFPNGFTIRAEKCPNRRGVEEIVAHYMDRVIEWEEFLDLAAKGDFSATWVAGGYPDPAWHDEAVAERLAAVDLLIVGDLFASPLTRRADVLLPSAAFAERSGSYVNHDDRIQSVEWAIRAPAGVQVEGRLFARLAGRQRLFQAQEVLAEVAARIPYFHSAASGVGPRGVDLKTSLLASDQPATQAATTAT